MSHLTAKSLSMTEEQTANFTLDLTHLHDSYFPPKYDFGEIYDLVHYLKDHGEPNPVIIDADDLQTNPESILRKFCAEMGIPFKESLLKWKSGDAALKTWITSRLAIATVADSYYQALLKTSYFLPLSGPPPKYEDLPKDVQQLVDLTKGWYEELYEMRLKP